MRKLWLWIAILVVGNMIWLSLDNYPPAWDQAAHLKAILSTQQWLTGRFWGGFSDLIHSFWGYPPLIYFIGGLVGAKFLNTVFLVAAVVGVYKLAGNKLLPAILFSLFPVIYDISRQMLLDLALTAWVVWGLYFWISKKDWGVLMMLILASLTKLNGFIYFLPIIASYWREPKKLVIYGLLYLAAVGWWWGVNWNNIYLYLTGLAGQGEELTDPMRLSSFWTWWHYFKLFFLHQLGPISAVLFLITSRKENKKLIWWLVATYVIFTVVKNKDFRFTMPLLPVVAVWWGWGLEKIFPAFGHPSLTRRVGLSPVTFLVLLWMGFNYIENSFSWPFKKPVVLTTPTFLMGEVKWIDFSDYPVREVRNAVWPNEKILSDLPPEPVKLLVIMNIAEINDNTLGLYRLSEEKTNVEIHGVDKWGQMDFDYYLVPDMETEVAPFYDTQLELRKSAVREIWGGGYEVVGEYGLPNGGKVYLFRVLKST